MGWHGPQSGECSCCESCSILLGTPSVVSGSWSQDLYENNYWTCNSPGELRLPATGTGKTSVSFTIGYSPIEVGDPFPTNIDFSIFFDGTDFSNGHRIRFRQTTEGGLSLTLQDVTDGEVTDIASINPSESLFANRVIYITEIGNYVSIGMSRSDASGPIEGNWWYLPLEGNYEKKGGQNFAINVVEQGFGEGLSRLQFLARFTDGNPWAPQRTFLASNICVSPVFYPGRNFKITDYNVPTTLSVEVSHSDFVLGQAGLNTRDSQCNDSVYEEEPYKYWLGPRIDDIEWVSGQDMFLNLNHITPPEFEYEAGCDYGPPHPPGFDTRNSFLWSLEDSCRYSSSPGDPGHPFLGCSRGVLFRVYVTDARESYCPFQWPQTGLSKESTTYYGDYGYEYTRFHQNVMPEELIRVWLYYMAYGDGSWVYPNCSGSLGSSVQVFLRAMFMSPLLKIGDITSGKSLTLNKTGEEESLYLNPHYAWDYSSNPSINGNFAPFNAAIGSTATVNFL